MSLKVAREQLGRIKTYYLRKETLRALAAAVAGLKALGSAPPPTDIRSILREGVQMLARDEEIRSVVKEGALIYQPGKEPILYQYLSAAYQKLSKEAGEEDHDTALARKIKLDQALNQGLRLLAQGNASEADAAFAEALKYYKDEHRLYPMIGKSLLEAKEIRRALPYLKRAMEIIPNDSEVKNLFEQCARLREELRQKSV